jgi:hypothetical protein
VNLLEDLGLGLLLIVMKYRDFGNLTAKNALLASGALLVG